MSKFREHDKMNCPHQNWIGYREKVSVIHMQSINLIKSDASQ
jgi:hypothetical protein